MNCFGVDDGIFSWADNGYSRTTGDHFTIKNSYFHDLTTRTSNGHEDGYQTEGASFGLIAPQHLPDDRRRGQRDRHLGLAAQLEEHHRPAQPHHRRRLLHLRRGLQPRRGRPGSASAAGGYTDTKIRYIDNMFSTRVSGCVGAFGVLASPGRPGGRTTAGRTDGWHRRGNRVLETGQNIDKRNPSRHGALCT